MMSLFTYSAIFDQKGAFEMIHDAIVSSFLIIFYGLVSLIAMIDTRIKSCPRIIHILINRMSQDGSWNQIDYYPLLKSIEELESGKLAVGFGTIARITWSFIMEVS